MDRIATLIVVLVELLVRCDSQSRIPQCSRRCTPLEICAPVRVGNSQQIVAECVSGPERDMYLATLESGSGSQPSATTGSRRTSDSGSWPQGSTSGSGTLLDSLNGILPRGQLELINRPGPGVGSDPFIGQGQGQGRLRSRDPFQPLPGGAMSGGASSRHVPERFGPGGQDTGFGPREVPSLNDLGIGPLGRAGGPGVDPFRPPVTPGAGMFGGAVPLGADRVPGETGFPPATVGVGAREGQGDWGQPQRGDPALGLRPQGQGQTFSEVAASASESIPRQRRRDGSVSDLYTDGNMQYYIFYHNPDRRGEGYRVNKTRRGYCTPGTRFPISDSCLRMCRADNHCPGQMVCCPSGCTLMCLQPIFRPEEAQASGPASPPERPAPAPAPAPAPSSDTPGFPPSHCIQRSCNESLPLMMQCPGATEFCFYSADCNRPICQSV